jgi:hypothetical protein
MSRVEEIEHAIEQLSPEELSRLEEWMLLRDQRRWDEQMDRDSASGKLDFLFDKAERESAALREWPPSE